MLGPDGAGRGRRGRQLTGRGSSRARAMLFRMKMESSSSVGIVAPVMCGGSAGLQPVEMALGGSLLPEGGAFANLRFAPATGRVFILSIQEHVKFINHKARYTITGPFETQQSHTARRKPLDLPEDTARVALATNSCHKVRVDPLVSTR